MKKQNPRSGKNKISFRGEMSNVNSLESALDMEDSTFIRVFVPLDHNSVINVGKEAILLTFVKQTWVACSCNTHTLCNHILIRTRLIKLLIRHQTLTKLYHTGVLYRKVFLEISQNSQKNTCARLFFLIKLQAWGLQLYEKRGSGTSVFLWILRNF